MKKLAAIFILFFAFQYLGAVESQLITYNPVYFHTQPVSLEVFEGEKAVFEADAVYYHTPAMIQKQDENGNYVWEKEEVTEEQTRVDYMWFVYKNDGKGWQKTGCTEKVLEVDASPEMDGYRYYCEASHSPYSKSSKIAALAVKPIEIIIEKEPKHVSLRQSSIAEFSASASLSSGKELSYKWQVDRKDGNGFVDAGCESPSLYVNATEEMDGYLFRCEVSGGGKTKITKTASLKFFESIEILEEPQDLALYEKQKGAFSFDAKDLGGKKLKYTWFVDKNDGKGWKKAGSSKDLKISASLKMNDWRYYCVATNGEETEISNEAKLTVYQNAKITQNPAAQKVYEYEDAKFEVGAEGHDLKYQWQYYNEISKKWINIQGATSSVYEPDADLEYDGRKFRCVVSNGGGTVITGAAALTVLQLPEILDYVSIVQDGWEMALDENGSPFDRPVVFEEYSAALRVFARGYKLKYQWQVWDQDSGDWQDVKGGTKATLAIKEITRENDGQCYRCIVYNDGGKACSNEVELDVMKPFAPKSLKGQSLCFPDSEQINFLAFASASSGSLIGYGGSKITGVKYKRISFLLAELKFTLQIPTANGKFYKQTFNGVVDFYNDYFYCDYDPETDMYEFCYDIHAAREAEPPMPESIVGKTFYFDFFRNESKWLEVSVISAKKARYDLYDEEGGRIATFYGSFSYKRVSDFVGTFSGSFKDGMYTVKIENGVMALNDGGADPYYNMAISGYYYTGRAYFE